MGQEMNSEEQVVARAREAMANCNWTLGECAAIWTRKYAKGRTDAAFAELVGLSPEQVYQRRRVYETFGDVQHNCPKLSWSHYYAALTWDDAADCLSWADEMVATVAEMRAWRRAQHGEDLSEEPGGGEVSNTYSELADSGPSGESREKQTPPVGPVPAKAVHDEEPAPSGPGRIPPASNSPGTPAVKSVLRAFARAVESLKSGIWQQAEPDQQSEVIDQVEGLREWLQQSDNPTATREGGLLVPRLQWCARVLTPQFFKDLTKPVRLLVEAAVEDLRQAVQPGRR